MDPPELLSLDRLPLPSLKVYTCLSVLAAGFSLYYIGTESGPALEKLSRDSTACRLLLDGDEVNLPPLSHSLTTAFASYFKNDYWWREDEVENNESVEDNDNASQLEKNVTESDCLTDREAYYETFTWQLFHWACQQPHCVWPLVNLLYCLLILASHAIQKSVFGSLRSSEEENIKDQFWNLVFYKVVFVFGVVDVQEIEDAVGWCFFVSVIGFLQLARQLCQERHNYLIMTNDKSKSCESRRHCILRLLTFIFLTSISLFLGVISWYLHSDSKDISNDFLDLKSVLVPFKPFDSLPLELPPPPPVVPGYDFNLGVHSAVFMLSEISLLILQTLHALTMCLFEHVHFRQKSWTWGWRPFGVLEEDKKKEDNVGEDEGDQEDLYLCAFQDINYKFEIICLLFDLIHHVHMFICCNLFLSMTSLIVSLQMRLRVKQIHAVLKRRRSFTSLNEHIEKYSDLDPEKTDQQQYSENCAICWESLSSQKSKVLPCNHTFHKTCLRKWLLVSMHCPSCRLSLLTEKELQLRRENEPRRRIYGPRPAYGIMGLLQTGQTLLDLFGGWDPLPDEYTDGPSESEEATALTPSSVQDAPVATPSHSQTATSTSLEQSPQTSAKN